MVVVVRSRPTFFAAYHPPVPSGAAFKEIVAWAKHAQSVLDKLLPMDRAEGRN